MERIFGKKEEVKKEVFSFEDAESFLSRNFNEKFQVFGSDASRIHSELQSIAGSMQESLKNLGRAEFAGRADSELLQNAVAHRKSFIQKMGAMTEKVKRPMQSDVDSILAFSSSISSAVSEADNQTVVDYHFLKELFEKEAKSAIDNFKVLRNSSDSFERLIDRNKEDMLSIRNVQKDLQSVKGEVKTLNEIEENLKNLDADISKLGDDYKKTKEELEKFDTSGDWLHFNELLEKKRAIEENISNMKSQAIQDFSKIERPLKKFRNLVDREIVKIDNEKILRKYVDSFFDTLIEEKNAEAINSILRSVQKNISEGKIELKDREKAADEIKQMIERNIIKNFLEKYMLLTADLEKLEKEISGQNALSIKNGMESKIAEIENQVEIKKHEMDKIRKQLEKMKNSLNERKIALEKTISDLAKRETKIKF